MLEAPPLPYDVHFLKRSDQLDYGIPVFSIMRNESYFFPHFLKHYRSLGISNFVIFADRCDDEFLETMLREHDVSIIRSNSLKYHQTFGQLESGWPKRLVQFIKEFISNQFFVGRWHLVVDADEFLILPAPMRDFPAYVQWLEGSGMDGASVVVSEWPSRDAALAFWNSPEYAQVKKLREGLADVQIMLVGS